jgi:hypothetical protein
MPDNHANVPVQLPTSVPLIDEADVVVVGGGPGGIGAAVAAAREGADVLLVEHYGFLGGMATAGEVNPFMNNHLGGKSLDTGVFEDWMTRILGYGGARKSSRTFDPYIARLAAEDLCVEAGVRLLYHHRAAHAQTDGRRLDTLVLHSKSGLSAVKARTFIDSTGDGDVAALAGCRFEFGDEEHGHCQPMTLCFKLKLNPRAIEDDADATDGDLYQQVMRQMDHIQNVYTRAQEDGRIDCPRENVLMFRGVEDDLVHFNTTRIIAKSSIDGRQLSEAEVEGRRQLRQLVDLLRNEVPIFRHCRIHSIAPQIGIRESRRIVGRNYVTFDDFKAGRRFEEAVARVTYMVDIHSPTGKGTQHVHLPKGQWYEVPWGCLLSADLDNLAIGSRCISVDHAVHSSVRVMAPVCSLGQAAGTAAGLARHQGIEISKVDGLELRRTLIDRGRSLLPHHEPVSYPDAPVDEEKLEAIATKTAARYSA